MGKKEINNTELCSMVHAMNLVGSKWKPILLYVLANGSVRFGKLLFLIPDISKKY